MDGFESRNPRFARYILGNATLETLASGFRWIEGPVWMGDANCLLFQDLPNDRTMRWSEGMGVSVYRSPSNYANGQTRDRQGRLIACSHRGRCLYRTEYDGRVTTLVDRHDGKRLNAPNDVVVKSDGSIWFTDPLYGISNDYEGGRQASEQPPAVYRFDPDSGDIRIVADDFDGPNGLAFSPDESRLYVAETGDQTATIPRQYIRAFDIGADRLDAVRRRHFSQDRARLLRRHACRRGRQHLEQRRRRRPLPQRGRRVAWQNLRALPGFEPDIWRTCKEPSFHRRLEHALFHLPELPRRADAVSSVQRLAASQWSAATRTGWPVSTRPLSDSHRPAKTRSVSQPLPNSSAFRVRRRASLRCGLANRRLVLPRIWPSGRSLSARGLGTESALSALRDRGFRNGGGLRAAVGAGGLEYDLDRWAADAACFIRRRHRL